MDTEPAVATAKQGYSHWKSTFDVAAYEPGTIDTVTSCLRVCINILYDEAVYYYPAAKAMVKQIYITDKNLVLSIKN